jgi:hypothetical protein
LKESRVPRITWRVVSLVIKFRIVSFFHIKRELRKEVDHMETKGATFLEGAFILKDSRWTR